MVLNANIRRSLPYKGTRYMACCSLCTRKIPDLPTAISFLSQRHLPDWRLLLRVPYCFFLIPFALLLGLSTWGRHVLDDDTSKDTAQCMDTQQHEQTSCDVAGDEAGRRAEGATCKAPGSQSWTEVEYASDGMVSLRCQQAPIGEATTASFATCAALQQASPEDVAKGSWTNVCLGFFDHVQVMQDGIKQRQVFTCVAQFLVECDKAKRASLVNN